MVYINTDFKKPHRKKSQGVKSGERAGHSKSPLIEMRCSGKCSLKTAIDVLEVCAIAQSCLNQVPPKSNSSSHRKNNSCNTFTYRSEFTVTVTSFSSKNQGPIIPPEEITHHTVTLGECKGFHAIVEDWCQPGSACFVC